MGDMVYHFTSVIRTNQIWMSGLINLEGQSPDVFHPQLGKIQTDIQGRRKMRDFPALVWFTTKTTVPKCLQAVSMIGQQANGKIKHHRLSAREANAVALRRLALGFSAAQIGVSPWREHYGYKTREGRELNRLARDEGDNPNDWWVSETPVDVMKISEVLIANGTFDTTMIRNDQYLEEIKKMVMLCKQGRVYIPPSWMDQSSAEGLASELRVPVAHLG